MEFNKNKMTRLDELALEFVKVVLNSSNMPINHPTYEGIIKGAYQRAQAYLEIEWEIKYGTEPKHKVGDIIVSQYGTHRKNFSDNNYYMAHPQFHKIKSITKGDKGWDYLLEDGLNINYETLADIYDLNRIKCADIVYTWYRIPTEEEILKQANANKAQSYFELLQATISESDKFNKADLIEKLKAQENATSDISLQATMRFERISHGLI
jgi:hypothetical protein